MRNHSINAKRCCYVSVKNGLLGNSDICDSRSPGVRDPLNLLNELATGDLG
jgi:hypothetical protein